MKQVLFLQPGSQLVCAPRWSLLKRRVPSRYSNTPAVLYRALDLIPGEGSGQHSIIPAEVGLVAKARWFSRARADANFFKRGKAFCYRDLRRTIFAMKAIGPQRSM